MKRNFYTVMSRRGDLLHQRAIWQEVVDHLAKFLDTDAFPATVGIRTDGGGGLTVPQDKIEVVLNEIKNGYMAEINEELHTIDNSEVAENVKQEKRRGKKTKKESAKSKGQAEVKTSAAGSRANKRKVGARK